MTESCLVDKIHETILIFERLRELKCRIAIDDFGTDYSSLNYLKHFPVTILKIDRSFVKDLPHNSGNRAIAQSVVDLATNLNMTTVAEGVKLPEQLEIFEEIGCTYVQGYLFCQPIPPDLISIIDKTSQHDMLGLRFREPVSPAPPANLPERSHP